MWTSVKGPFVASHLPDLRQRHWPLTLSRGPSTASRWKPFQKPCNLACGARGAVLALLYVASCAAETARVACFELGLFEPASGDEHEDDFSWKQGGYFYVYIIYIYICMCVYDMRVHVSEISIWIFHIHHIPFASSPLFTWAATESFHELYVKRFVAYSYPLSSFFYTPYKHSKSYLNGLVEVKIYRKP